MLAIVRHFRIPQKLAVDPAKRDQVSVIGGDSAISPYGGGAWASRGTAIGGEAALRAGVRGVLFPGGDLMRFLSDEALLPTG